MTTTRNPWYHVAVCCVAVVGSGSLAEATVILLDNMLTSWAYTGQAGGAEEKITQVAVELPFLMDDMAVAGDTSSSTSYDIGPTAAAAALRLEFDHVRDDSVQSFSMSDGFFDFQVSDPVRFAVDGNYAFAGIEQKFVQVRLFDNLHSTANPVFDWTQTTMEADESNFVYSHEGELLPGNSYRLKYRFMVASVGGAGEADGSGQLSFVISDPSVDSLLGDTNDDGRVDIDDLNNVRNNFGSDGSADGSLAGDAFPFDGTVDIDDLNSVRNQFGAVAAVPEPSAAVLTLLAVGLPWLCLWHRL